MLVSQKSHDGDRHDPHKPDLEHHVSSWHKNGKGEDHEAQLVKDRVKQCPSSANFEVQVFIDVAASGLVLLFTERLFSEVILEEDRSQDDLHKTENERHYSEPVTQVFLNIV